MSPRTILLSPIVTLTVENQLKIRQIRNEPSVRAVMYTDHEIGVDEHLGWLSRLKTDERNIVFAVMDADRPLGVVSFNAIDRRHRKADWAFYLTTGERGSGLGSALEFAAIEFAFWRLELEKLNCEVIETNKAVAEFHQRFGFEVEGFKKSNIIKQESRIGVFFLGLTKEAWVSRQAETAALVHKRQINVDFDWSTSNPAKTPIDQIEAARAKNNLNWMAILRLALDKSPEAGNALIEEIGRLDREISSLTQQLLSR